MGTSYAEQLADPRWRAKRDQLLEKSSSECQDCGRVRPLQVHHTYYDSGRFAWDYPDDCFKLLCRDCHSLTTEAVKSLLYTMGKLDADQVIALTNALQNFFSERPQDKQALITWLVVVIESFSE